MKLLRKALHWLRLVASANPGSSGIQLLGAPGFRGGPDTKAAQLRGILTREGAPFGTLLALSAVSAPLFLVKWLTRGGIRLLVNQNGVYYPSWAGAGYEAKNAYLRRLNSLAYHTFFQSEFARESYAKWVGAPPKDSSLLYNPVDCSQFRLLPRAENAPVTLLFFCDFRKSLEVYWEKLLSWPLSSGFPLQAGGYRILAVGNSEGDFAQELKERAGSLPIEFHSNVGRQQLPSLLGRADLLVHLIYNDVCPNKVLEAMACGVWTICVSAGGSRELVGDAGTVLPVEAGYGAPVLPSDSALNVALAEVLRQPWPALRGRARKRAEQFDLPQWQAAIREKCVKGS